MVTYRLPKALLKIDSKITYNIVSITKTIAYKCPILTNLRDRIDRKKRFPNDQLAT
jgi:hypothetical protein